MPRQERTKSKREMATEIPDHSKTAVPNITVALGETISLTSANTLSVDTITYAGDFILENGQLTKYLYDGGYFTFNNGQAIAHYYIQDHQGNIRTVVNNSNTIEQINHYYPFGAVYSDAGSNDALQRYKYNGKELDRMHGLNQYDYGARNYDPLLCRFTQMDPSCEKYYGVSPYTYCLNNPIRLIDIKGLDPGDYFLTMDEAAIDFGKFYNYFSIQQGLEYASFIYKAKDSWGNIYYSYTIPSSGGHDSSNLQDNGRPTNSTIVGRAHTHGKWESEYVNSLGDDGNLHFSDTDISIYENNKVYGYLATPDGKMFKYDPGYKSTTLISTDMPKDRVFFKKGERNIVRYIHKEGNTSERRKALWYEMKARDSFLNRFLSHFIKGK